MQNVIEKFSHRNTVIIDLFEGFEDILDDFNFFHSIDEIKDFFMDAKDPDDMEYTEEY